MVPSSRAQCGGKTIELNTGSQRASFLVWQQSILLLRMHYFPFLRLGIKVSSSHWNWRDFIFLAINRFTKRKPSEEYGNTILLKGCQNVETQGRSSLVGHLNYTDSPNTRMPRPHSSPTRHIKITRSRIQASVGFPVFQVVPTCRQA